MKTFFITTLQIIAVIAFFKYLLPVIVGFFTPRKTSGKKYLKKIFSSATTVNVNRIPEGFFDEVVDFAYTFGYSPFFPSKTEKLNAFVYMLEQSATSIMLVTASIRDWESSYDELLSYDYILPHIVQKMQKYNMI